MSALTQTLILALGLVLTIPSFAGVRDGGGGDTYALEFNSIGRALVHDFDRLGIRPDTGVSEESLSNVINTTQVETVDHPLFLGDREVDAINYPDRKVIQLSRPRWESYPNDRQKKAAIVLHEYLGVAGARDDHYQISGPALQRLQPALKDPIRLFPHFFCTVSTNQDDSLISRFLAPNSRSGEQLLGVYDTAVNGISGGVILSLPNPWNAGPLADYAILFEANADWWNGEHPTLKYRIYQKQPDGDFNFSTQPLFGPFLIPFEEMEGRKSGRIWVQNLPSNLNFNCTKY